MISILSSKVTASKIVDGARKSREILNFAGISTDTKPTGTYGTTLIGNGSTFIEMNTGYVYMYDEANSTWRKLG